MKSDQLVTADSDKTQRLQEETAQYKQRLATLEKLVQQQQERIERLNRPRFKLPVGKRSNATGCFARVIIPDSHGSHVQPEAAAAMLSDLESIRPLETVWLGDHLECGGFLAQNWTLGYVAECGQTFEEDIAAANTLLDRVQGSCNPKAVHHYIEGNHECLHPSHEVLTKRGWVPISVVTLVDYVAGLDVAKNVVWLHPTKLHAYDFSGELCSYRSRAVSMLVTENHRLVYVNTYSDRLAYRTVSDVLQSGKESSPHIPTAGYSGNREFLVSDDEIRLAAWLLTDGSVACGKCAIYQSKQHNLPKIRDLLRRLDLSFTESSRQRKPPVICGVQVKTARRATQFDFHVASMHRIARLMELGTSWERDAEYVKSVPSWVHLLSHRQFGIMLDTVVAGDGSVANVGRWARTTTKRTTRSACTVYGTRNLLEQFQSVCVTHGVRATLASRTRKGKHSYWCLNVNRQPKFRLVAKNFERVPYVGKVYCLTMPTGNFLTRLDGKVHVTGNSRIEKWCVTQALKNRSDADYLLKHHSEKTNLNIDKRGFHYYPRRDFQPGCRIPGTIQLGKCHFTHGSHIGRHAASSHLVEFGANVVYGHTHRCDSFVTRSVSAGEIGAWCPGCLCKLQPYWRHTQLTGWSHGYGLQLVRPNGEFLHINVPIIDGRSFLIPLTESVTRPEKRRRAA